MAWNRPAEKKVEQKPKASKMNVWVIGCSLLAVIAVVGFFLLRGSSSGGERSEGKDRHIRETTPKIAKTKPKQEASSASKTDAPKTNDATIASQDKALKSIAGIAKPDVANRPKPKIPFATSPSDQAIANVISLGPGHAIPDTPMASEEKMERDFEESLKHPIVIEDDDSPHIKQLKEQIIAIREEIVERRKEGKTVKQILMEHKEQVNANVDLRRNAMKQFREIRAEQGDEAAWTYMEKANTVLDKAGAQRITWSLSAAERRAIREAKAEDKIINVRDFEK